MDVYEALYTTRAMRRVKQRADARGVANLDVRVLFSFPIPGTHCGGILTSSTVWFDGQAVAPVLYDVILRNVGTTDLQTIYVALLAEEI
jgi:hypothetical protein